MLKKKYGIILIFVCLIINLVLATAFAQANATAPYQGTYVGYGEIPQNFEVDGENEPLSEQPMMTVLTAGLGGSAANWSNDLHMVNDSLVGFGDFAYDPDSLIERLRDEAIVQTGGADVFWAKFSNNNLFSLIPIEKKTNAFEVYSDTGVNTVEALTDVSNHIIIVLGTNLPDASNADAYAEFNFMMDRLVYDIAYINDGVYPKINLIGHSRGGLINMDYAQNHPRLIDSIYSLGTPYFGSNFGKINIFVDALGIKSSGFDSIQDENEQIARAENWNDYYDEKYSHIKLYPFAGYSSLNFLQELVNAGYTKAYGNFASSIEQLIYGFSFYRWPVLDLVAKNRIADEIRAAEAASGIPQTSADTIKSVLDKALNGSMIFGVTIYDDLFVDYESQIGTYDALWGYRGMGGRNINPYSNTKRYDTISGLDLSKSSVDGAPIVHNLESRDPFFIDRIVWSINLGAEPKVLECDCSENGDGTLTLNKLKNWTSQGTLAIPSEYDGKMITKIGADFMSYYIGLPFHTIDVPETIVEIGANAFRGYTPLQTVNLCGGLEKIEDFAFSECINLETIFIPETVREIGNGVFVGCNQLNITVSSTNPYFAADGNILYDKNKTKLIAAGKIDSTITVSDTVTEIAPHAMNGNSNLSTLHIKQCPALGRYAFAMCENLTSVYFYSYDVPIVGANAFLNNSFTLFVPHSKQQAYSRSFQGFTNSIASIPIQVSFVSEGETIDTKSTYFGANIQGLVNPFKLGYDFSGWYDNASDTGTSYEEGGLWDTTQNLTLYAKWTPRTFYIIFDGTGSENLEDKQVTYDAPIGPLPVIELEGHTFAGWKNSHGVYYTEDTIWKDLNNVILTSDVFSTSYTVVLNKQSEAGGDDRVNPIFGSPMPPATAPSRTGYTFQGYFTESNGQGTKYYNSNMTSARNWDIAQDRTLYAYWIGNEYTVTLNNQNTEKFGVDLVSMSQNNIIYISFIPSYSGMMTLWTTHTQGDPYLLLYDQNFQVLSYNDDGNGSLDAKITYSVSSGMRYVVGFRSVGNSITVGPVHYSGVSISYTNIFATVKVRYGSMMPTAGIPIPTKIGYEFIQYNTDPNGQGTSYYYGPNIASDSAWDQTSNTTLYAVWQKVYYDIALNLGYSAYTDTIRIGYQDEVVATNQLSKYVENRIGYDFKGFYSQPNGKGIKYFSSKATLLYTEYQYELISTGQKWKIPANGEIYAHWEAISLNFEYEVIIQDSDEPRKIYYQPFTHGKTATITCPEIDGYTYQKMWLNGVYYTETSVTLQNVQLKRNLSTNEVYLWYPAYGYPDINQGGLFMVYTKNPCVAEGTLITLADGSQKAVETLTGDEMLLVWDLRTGSFGAAPILFIDHDSATDYQIIRAFFSDGTDVKVIGEHAFFDFNLNKYVFFRTDAAQYIGHWFNKQTVDDNGNLTWTRVQLTDVRVYTEGTTAWSPVTYGHLCYYVNGMLSMPGATEGFINLFDVDSDTMTIDEAAYLADIERYGLFTYEEFAELYPVPERIFEAFNGQYLKIAIGKGLMTPERLQFLMNRYASFFDAEESSFEGAEETVIIE